MQLPEMTVNGLHTKAPNALQILLQALQSSIVIQISERSAEKFHR